MTGFTRSGLTGYFCGKKNTGEVRCRWNPPLQNPRCGPVTGGHPPRKTPVWSGARWTPTGDRDRGPRPYPVGFLDFRFFLKSRGTPTFPRVRMVVSDDEDDRELSSVDGDDDGYGEGCVDEVIIVEKSTAGHRLVVPDPFCCCRRETRTTLLG